MVFIMTILITPLISKEEILHIVANAVEVFRTFIHIVRYMDMLLQPMSLETLAYSGTFLSRTEIGLHVVNILTIITWRNLQQEYFFLEEERSEAIDGHDDMSL